MKTLTMYGASDDLWECAGIEGADEFGCFGGHNDGMFKGPIQIVIDDEVMLQIYAVYDGTWQFAISPGECDEAMPDWEIRRSWGGAGRSEYSEYVEIDCPNDAVLVVSGTMDPDEY